MSQTFGCLCGKCQNYNCIPSEAKIAEITNLNCNRFSFYFPFIDIILSAHIRYIPSIGYV